MTACLHPLAQGQLLPTSGVAGLAQEDACLQSREFRVTWSNCRSAINVL